MLSRLSGQPFLGVLVCFFVGAIVFTILFSGNVVPYSVGGKCDITPVSTLTETSSSVSADTTLTSSTVADVAAAVVSPITSSLSSSNGIGSLLGNPGGIQPITLSDTMTPYL